MKWKAYKKQGTALIDSSQEGTQPMNTTFAGYDDTISYQAMQALDLALERIENTCSAITGVFREKLGGIEQRDAVTNVQVGIRYSSYTTKQFFYMMDLVTREILLDLLDMCKIVFKDGIIGTIILGDRLNKVFTALPEYYTMTDFDIHITDTSEMIKDSELLKQLSFEFSKNNNIDPEIVIDIITSKSLTKMKSDVTNAIRKKREESIEAMQMQQQLEAASKEVQRAQEEIRKLQSQVQQLNQEKLNIEKERLNKETEVAWYKARTDRDLKERELKVKENQVKAEVLQLYDSNRNNDEIKNI
jgi:CRISPR/Cas system CMR-associated protein Cmr5 small subunit